MEILGDNLIIIICPFLPTAPKLQSKYLAKSTAPLYDFYGLIFRKILPSVGYLLYTVQCIEVIVETYLF